MRTFMLLAVSFLWGILGPFVLGKQQNSTMYHTTPEKTKTKVFGLGLSRTGTTSMVAAMRLLGFETLHSDTSFAPYMHHLGKNVSLTGQYDSVDAVWGIPTAVYYRELLEAYPNAKFVLTVRDSREWFYSIEKYLKYTFDKGGRPIPERVRRLHRMVYGSRGMPTEEWIAAFDQHNHDVQAFFSDRPDQLLTINVGQQDTWGQLCGFLGVENGPCSQSGLGVFPYEKRASYESIDKKNLATVQGSSSTEDAFVKKNAYVTVLCEPSKTDQTGYLRLLLVMIETIREFDQISDIVVLVLGSMSTLQERLLTNFGFEVIHVGHFGQQLSSPPLGRPDPRADACYRAKFHALKLTQYKKIIYMDSDVFLKQDVQHAFKWPGFTGFVGKWSPINGGFLVMEPSLQAFVDLLDIASSDSFNELTGWLDYGPFPDWIEPQKEADWSFWCAHSDQGLWYYYYGLLTKQLTLLPQSEMKKLFTHFTAKDKPFLHDSGNLDTLQRRFRKPISRWFEAWNRVQDHLKDQGYLTLN